MKIKSPAEIYFNIESQKVSKLEIYLDSAFDAYVYTFNILFYKNNRYLKD